MASHDEKYLDACAAYALGALDGDELRDFEAHLRSGCQVCGNELAGHRRVSAFLPAALPQITPPAELRERILFAAGLTKLAKKEVERRTDELLSAPPEPAPLSEPARTGRGRVWLRFTFAAALVIMLAGFGLYIRTLLGSIETQRGVIAEQEGRITLLSNEVEKQKAIFDVLASRNIDVVTMNGQTINPVGYGKIIWDLNRRQAILQVSNLPAPPEGKDYQLWAIKDKQWVSAGVFAVTGEKENFFKVQAIDLDGKEGVSVFAVTIEPKGGVPQPTGAIHLVGSLSP